MKLPISVIILTYNEEKNIEACLKSVYDWVDEIFIVDSYSTDKTLEIAKKYTDKIYQHEFKNQAKQFNWALENLPLKGTWIMRLDADERWTHEAFEELEEIVKVPELNGIYIKLRIYFMHKWIKYGGFYPNYFLRVFKRGKGKIENRMMDEHIIMEGKTAYLKNDILEYNLKDRNGSIEEFIFKHINYAKREALDYLAMKYGSLKPETIANIFRGKTEQKRYLKENFYYKLPLFLRAFAYFLYRYFLKLGFLDGKEGLIFHFLQGFWYRFLVDAKIYEIEKKSKAENKSIKDIIKEMYGIDI
ncbi:MAG: glycosyltransferase family 2 protein [Elusimicrobia bacterium]|jgi:glycosyltransferase involved in cell wall biosynthesis|nr:glycosyltransferase family 2 protein [Elusimicrobiota bacterium]